MLLGLSCIACTKENPLDFWKITYDQIESYLKTNSNIGKNWHIGLQGRDLAVSKETPDVTIREYEDQYECSLSFQMDSNDQPYIVYQYTTESEAALGRTKEKSLELKSTDADFKMYDMKYSQTLLEDGNFVLQDTASGTLRIDKDQIIEYDAIPLLKESMTNLNTMIENIEKTFDIDYAKTSFVNLPALAQKTNIEEVEDISQETADGKTYYSAPEINAKGFSLVTCLEISKENPEDAIFSEFNVERQSNEFSYNVHLNQQSQENCYVLEFPFDSDFSYIAYIDKTNAYLYDSSMSIEQMIEDINQGGSQASVFLSTENENYKE